MVKKWKLERLAAGLPVREPEVEPVASKILMPRNYVDNDGVVVEKGFSFWCPACKHAHNFITWELKKTGKPLWKFDGNMERPTFSPSLRYFVHKWQTINGEWQEVKPVVEVTTCHLHVVKGMINFCADNPHAFNGKSVPLPALPVDYSY